MKGNQYDIVRLDKYATSVIWYMSRPLTRNKSFMNYMQWIEYSCHGLVWIIGCLLSIWCFWSKSLFQLQVNLLLGLIVDIIIVAIIKAMVRRRRPVGNRPSTFEVGPDKFSFPSGHMSRSFFLVYFFSYTYYTRIFSKLLFLWSLLVAYSRITLRKHFLFDVLGGTFLGIATGWLLSFVTINEEVAAYIVSFVTDETFEGADYHV